MTPSLATLLKVVVTTLACAQLIRTDRDLFTALKIFVFSVLFVYAQNISEIQYLRAAGLVTEDERFAGTLSNANTAAIFALTVIWAAILLLVRSKKALVGTSLYFAPIGISLIILYYSGSKKGLLGLALLVLFVARLLYIRQSGGGELRKSLIVVIAILLIIAAAYFIYKSPFFFRMGQLFSGISTTSDSNRMDLAREAIHVWLMNWRTFFTGVGFDNFWTYNSLGTYAHSTPLELLASNGIIGLSLFLGFLGLLIGKFVRLFRSTPLPEWRSHFFAIVIFLFIFTFFMVTAVMHDSKELLPILGCLAGYGQYQLRGLDSHPKEGPLAATGHGA
jgi:O-antigen ligase